MNSPKESGNNDGDSEKNRKKLLEKMKRSSDAFVSIKPDGDQDSIFDDETQRLVDSILGLNQDAPTQADNAGHLRGKASESTASAGRGFLGWGPVPERKPKTRGTGFGVYSDGTNPRDVKAESSSKKECNDKEIAARNKKIELEKERDRKEQEQKEKKKKAAEKKAAEKTRKIEKLKSQISSQRKTVNEQRSRLRRLNEKIAAQQEKIEGIDFVISMTEDSQSRSDLGIKRADFKAQLLNLNLKRIEVQTSLSNKESRLEQLIRKVESLSFGF